MEASPWSKHVTKRPEGFTCQFGDGRLIMATGGLSCMSDIATPDVVIMRQSRRDTSLSPYSPELQQWRGAGTPCARFHPFAIPHMFASGLVPQSVVDKLVTAMKGKNPTHVSVRITERCGLLERLGVKTMEMALGTAYNSSVVALVPSS